MAYRLYPPDADPATAAEDDGRMLDELFTTAAICRPLAGARLAAGSVALQGYALGQGGLPLDRVEVSADDGQTWQAATFVGKRQPWAWQLWQAVVALAPGPQVLVARAVDIRGHGQPADLRAVWNFKGYMNHAWHRVRVHAEG